MDVDLQFQQPFPAWLTVYRKLFFHNRLSEVIKSKRPIERKTSRKFWYLLLAAKIFKVDFQYP
jgi:hypothetical protein